jgi:hypothetical protein
LKGGGGICAIFYVDLRTTFDKSVLYGFLKDSAYTSKQWCIKRIIFLGNMGRILPGYLSQWTTENVAKGKIRTIKL